MSEDRREKTVRGVREQMQRHREELERHRAGTRPAPTGPGRWKRESTRDGGRRRGTGG